ASPSGWMAEHTSWRNPGRVTSAVREPPPTVPAASTTLMDHPARASSIAAARPLGPALTTTASSSGTGRAGHHGLPGLQDHPHPMLRPQGEGGLGLHGVPRDQAEPESLGDGGEHEGGLHGGEGASDAVA